MRYSRIIIKTIFLLFSNYLISQTIEYSVTKASRKIGQIDTITYYWKIDSTKSIEIENIKYYGFILGEDTLDVKGYININLKLKKYSFINFEENKSNYKSNDVQVFFLKNNGKYKINFFGSVGTLNIFDVKHIKQLYFVKVIHLEDILPSDTFYITELVFSDKPYPLLIYFSNGGDDIHIGNAQYSNIN